MKLIFYSSTKIDLSWKPCFMEISAYSLFYVPLRSGIFVVHAYVLKPFFITCFRFEEILFDIRMSVFKNMGKGQGSEFSCLYAVVHMCHI